ncbi:glycosyltransferase [Portibacter lacus]|uniref:Glycosyltransferase family 2 protein n=1 Tax=Portibacter lacus TaxID=1099794 RepID=A0AA37WDT2_9BACT|nr:hypothetical protein [Portibacter lacus]GLR15450.1 hypothetical protein GCM10007940_00650 [Portibacter lacus]
MKQYLQKQNKTSSLIHKEPNPDLKLIVVIPAYKETQITETIRSLYDCDQPTFATEIIVFVNGKEQDSEEVRAINEVCFSTCLALHAELSTEKLTFHFIKQLDFKSKKGGVGLARKVLMDEACFRFNQLDKPKGIIVNLDADCAVAKNYFIAISDFMDGSTLNAASIHYEHVLGNESIIFYELHLRYFVGMQALLNLPFAFQTVGSAMAVDAKTYAAVGGMNTRKAGEDFYFMHKFIKIGVCGNIYSTTVFPSDRVSDRVPFGTGKAIGDMQDGNPFLTYNPESFDLLKPLVEGLHQLQKGEKLTFSKALQAYFDTIQFDEKVAEIRNNTTNFKAFKKRFFQFFDAFKLMKALHFLRDNGYPDVHLDKALPTYFNKISAEYLGVNKASLEKLRTHDLRFKT